MNSKRDIALFDIYAGLIRIGYTRAGAVRALIAIGVAFSDAKLVADSYEGKL